MTENKRFNLKFYDLEFHTKLKIQAVKEKITMQDLIIKACKEYLEKAEKMESKK